MIENSRGRRESGFTVVELAITLLLFGIVSLIILGFLDSTSRITSTTSANVRAERDGMLALRTMTQDVRAGTDLRACPAGAGTLPYDTCLQFDVKRPGASAVGSNMSTPTTDPYPDCTSTISYRLSAGSVLQSRSDSGCATNPSWTGRKVIDVTNSLLFAYYDRLGRPISITSACSTDPNQPVCVPRAKTVKLSIAVAYQGQSSGPLTLSSTAALRNNR